jgi:hypothetical protein
MGFVVRYQLNRELPKLAWLAKVDMNSENISVVHGPSVECRNDWLVEGVWDDDFERGNFHQSENFFGTGMRVEGDRVYFVPSSATVDRLLYCEHEQKLLVSNSLPLLLAATGATLDDDHDYYRESLTICEGIDKYEKEFTIKHKQISNFYQLYYKNMVLSDAKISFEKRCKPRKIESYEHYVGLLKEILSRIRDNYESEMRTIPISAFTTLSSGYDSTAVTCLAKDLGVKTCFTGCRLEPPFPMKWYKRVQENATPVARRLGLDIHYSESRRASVSEDELYFLAVVYPKFSMKVWSEIGLHSMTSFIEKNCAAAVVFTGNFGGVMWDVNIGDEYLNEQVKPKFPSGNFFMEIRLKSGFIQIPAPFILAGHVKEIINIGRSAELDPWRLNNSYDRPIPRRIAETAGVPRHVFGMKKRYLMDSYLWPLNEKLKNDFLKYIKIEYGIGVLNIYTIFIIQQINRLIQRIGKNKRNFKLTELQKMILSKKGDLFYLMTQWAIQILTRRTAAILSQQDTRNFIDK